MELDKGPLVDKIQGTVKQFPYRTARVSNVFLVVPRDTVRQLEEQLAEAAGTRPDNHTVYEIDQHDSKTYLMFSDFSVNFGRSVEEKRW